MPCGSKTYLTKMVFSTFTIPKYRTIFLIILSLVPFIKFKTLIKETFKTMSKPTYPNAWKPGNLPRGVVLERQGPALFDPLTATAHELQMMMIGGTLKSTDLVEEYVRQIEKHNGYLRAVSVYAPSAFEQAKELDAKRRLGDFMGPLHGIPVLIKVTLFFFCQKLIIDTYTTSPGYIRYRAEPRDADYGRGRCASEYQAYQKCTCCRQGNIFYASFLLQVCRSNYC